MRLVRREGSGEGASIITLILIIRNKKVRKAMDK
jgi:hypothetical protein